MSEILTGTELAKIIASIQSARYLVITFEPKEPGPLGLSDELLPIIEARLFKNGFWNVLKQAETEQKRLHISEALQSYSAARHDGHSSKVRIRELKMAHQTASNKPLKLDTYTEPKQKMSLIRQSPFCELKCYTNVLTGKQKRLVSAVILTSQTPYTIEAAAGALARGYQKGDGDFVGSGGRRWTYRSAGSIGTNNNNATCQLYEKYE